MRWTTLIPCLLALSLIVGCSGTRPGSALTVSSGDRFFAEGNWDSAIREYERAISTDKGINYSRIQIGDKLARAYAGRAGDYFAQAELNSATGLSTYASKYYNLAHLDYLKAFSLGLNQTPDIKDRIKQIEFNLRTEEERYLYAMLDAISAVAGDNTTAPARTVANEMNKVGLLHLTGNDLAVADSDFSAVISKYPRYPEAYYYRGYVNLMQKKYDQAISDLDKTVELNPQYTYAYVNRARAWLGTGDYNKAIADLSKTLEITPDCGDAYYWKGSAYFASKQYDLACSDLAKAIDAHTSYLKSAYLKYSAAFVEAKQYDKSIEVLTNLLKIYPGYPLGYYNRAIAYMNLEKWDAAVSDWDKYLSLDLEDKYKNSKEAIAARDQCMLKIKGAAQ